MAMEAAYKHIAKVFEEYAKISGRKYELIETYKMDDAEVALFILNSPYDTVLQSVDTMRAEGKKVGAIPLLPLPRFPRKSTA